MIDPSTISTKAQLIRACDERGSYFFSAGTMRFFQSRVLADIATMACQDGSVDVYFITSERYGDSPRFHHVRVARFEGESVNVRSVDERRYETAREARKALRNIQAERGA